LANDIYDVFGLSPHRGRKYHATCIFHLVHMSNKKCPDGQTNAKDEGTDWSVILEVLRASADSFLGAVCLPFSLANSVFHTNMLHGKRRKGRTSVKLGSNLKRLVTK